jgi:hypothetical protein
VCDAQRLALSVSDFGKSTGLGRRKSYEVARRIGVRVDGRLIVPVAAAERWLASLPGGGEAMTGDAHPVGHDGTGKASDAPAGVRRAATT